MKRSVDFIKGETNRIHDVEIINHHLLYSGLRLRRIHNEMRLMHISEIVKNVRLKNMLFESPKDHAMGLDYVLVDTEKRIPMIRLMIMYKDRSGLYEKVPADWKHDSESYLKLLQSLDYHILIIDDSEYPRRYSNLIPLSTVVENWDYGMEKSKGNTNRLSFRGPVSKIKYHLMEEQDLFGNSLLSTLLAFKK